jgi:hypothetical protein
MVVNRISHRSARCVLTLIAVISFIVFLRKWSPEITSFTQLKEVSQGPHQVLNTVNASDVAYNHIAGAETHCTTGRVGKLQVPICTYSPADDPVVSAFIQRGDYWEPEWVDRIVQLLHQHRKLIAESCVGATAITSSSTAVSFVDIGSNVGAYSLAAAQAGYHVSMIGLTRGLNHRRSLDLPRSSDLSWAVHGSSY